MPSECRGLKKVTAAAVARTRAALANHSPPPLYASSLTGTRKDSVPQVLLPEEEKLIIEETRSNGQTIIEEK